MKRVIAGLVLLLLASGVAFATPSSAVLNAGPTTTAPTLDLEGANWSVFNSSDFAMKPLGSSHYVWDTQHIVQNSTPMDTILHAWANVVPPLMASM
jgi:hypothetical protein